MENIPKKIDHGHIIDSVLEIRFSPKDSRTSFIEILAGIKSLIPDYTYEATDIPKQIRITDPQFSFAIEGVLKGKMFSVGIGYNSLVFNCQNGYKSWNEFCPFIETVLNRVKELGVIESINRIGIRFTNFFEGMNDLNKFKAKVEIGSKEVDPNSQVILKFSSSSDGVLYNVTLANLAVVGGRKNAGTLLDVDAYIGNAPIKISELSEKIEFVHLKEKEMFFSLLNDQFLKSLNPVY